MNSEPIVEPRRPAWEALLVFAGAAATYGVTAALTIRPAAVSALANVQAGEPGTPYEFVVSEAQAVLGTSPYWSAVVLSVIAAALAAAAAVVAGRTLGLARRQAVLLGLLVASCPAVVLFATQPGSPALGLACAALSLVWLARWMVSGGVVSAVVAGVLAALGAAVDAGGALAPLALAAIGFEFVRERAVGTATGRAGLQGARVFGVLALVALAVFGPASRDVLAHGWLRACFPMSVVWLVSLLGASSGILTVAIVPCVAVSLALAPDHAVEGGAFLALVLPLAWLAQRVAPRRVLPAVVIVGVVIGVLRVAAHDESQRVHALAGGLREVIEDPAKARLFVRDERELGYVIVAAGQVDAVTVDAFITTFESLAEGEFYRVPIEDAFEHGMIALMAEGYSVYFTHGAEDLLRDLPYRVRHHVAVRLFGRLRDAFRLVPVEVRGFRAKRLEPNDK